MLKFINVGLGRTGTMSLKLALERLGFGPCFHMFDIVGSDKRLEQWERVVCDGQRPDWKALFDGYASAAGGPCALYYRQMMEACPSAKFILTVRDAERWYQSTYDTLYQFAVRSAEFSPRVNSAQSRLHRVTHTMVWNGLFGGRFSDKTHAIEVFRNHNQEVVDTIEPGSLLVYDVVRGWEPLCAFLEVDVPPEDFPRANDGQSMRTSLRRLGSEASTSIGGSAPAPGRA